VSIELKIKTLNDLKISIKSIFAKTTNTLPVYGDIAETTIRLIKGFTRLGKHSVDGESYKSLPELADSTKKQRKQKAKYNKTAELFKPDKSNLTFSGQLLESLKLLKVNILARSVDIGPEGTRTPYRNKNGTLVQKTPTNEKLAQYVAKQGRPFLMLDKKGKTQLKNVVLKHLKRQLKSR